MSESPYRILVSDKLSSRGLAWLQGQEGFEVDARPGLSPETLLEIIGGYDALVIRSGTRVTAEVLDRAGRLQVIGRAGIGVDNVDVPEATRRGVIVMNEPSGNNITTAEHALALLFALARHVPQAHQSTSEGGWERGRFTGTEVSGRTLGLIGFGNIGRIVAERAVALKMEVLAHDPYVSAATVTAVGARPVDMDELLERADFLSVHTPLLPQTRGLVGAEAFAAMKDGVRIINAARGGIIDEAALVEALDSGKVAGAAVDVYEEEPPPVDHPLRTHPKVVCTPHLGASTVQAQERVAVALCRQVVSYLRDGEIQNAVNLPRVQVSAQGALAQQVVLGRRLGRLLAHLAEGISAISVVYRGDVFESGSGFVGHAVLEGLLSAVTERPVNLVSAPSVAKEMGWAHEETFAAASGPYRDGLTVQVETADGSCEATGAIVGEDARLVALGGVALEASLGGVILVTENADRPGVIGGVGTVLGGAAVNIARCQVGRHVEDGGATAIWNLDTPAADETLAQLRGVAHVERVVQVVFD